MTPIRMKSAVLYMLPLMSGDGHRTADFYQIDL